MAGSQRPRSSSRRTAERRTRKADAPHDAFRYSGVRVESNYRFFERYKRIVELALHAEVLIPRPSSGANEELGAKERFANNTSLTVTVDGNVYSLVSTYPEPGPLYLTNLVIGAPNLNPNAPSQATYPRSSSCRPRFRMRTCKRSELTPRRSGRGCRESQTSASIARPYSRQHHGPVQRPGPAGWIALRRDRSTAGYRGSVPAKRSSKVKAAGKSRRR